MRTHLSSVAPSTCCADRETRDETRIISSILAGQTHAFQELIGPYEGLVYQLSFRVLRNEADAEDATQETFLSAYRNLARFRFESQFSTWLCSIAINAARTALRQRIRLEREESRGEADLENISASHKPTPFDIVEFHELDDLFQDAIAELPPIYREVVVLRVVEEQDVRSIAQEIQSSNGVVKVRLHRARRMLRRHLAGYLKQSAIPSVIK